MERPKLELDLQKPTTVTLLFNDCIEGTSKFGKFYLYAVSNGDDKEYSLFAPEQIHNTLKTLKKGDKATITKLAVQKGNKLVIDYDIKIIRSETPPPQEQSAQQSPSETSAKQLPPKPDEDFFYLAMEKSFEEAIRLQAKYNGMANVNQIAVTLFISRVKGNNYN